MLNKLWLPFERCNWSLHLWSAPFRVHLCQIHGLSIAFSCRLANWKLFLSTSEVVILRTFFLNIYFNSLSTCAISNNQQGKKELMLTFERIFSSSENLKLKLTPQSFKVYKQEHADLECHFVWLASKQILPFIHHNNFEYFQPCVFVLFLCQ